MFFTISKNVLLRGESTFQKIQKFWGWGLQLWTFLIIRVLQYFISWVFMLKRKSAGIGKSVIISIVFSFTAPCWTGVKFLPVQPSSRGACGGILHSNWGRLVTRRRLRRTHSMSTDYVAQRSWLHQQRWTRQQKKKWPSAALWEPGRPEGKKKLGTF